MLPWCLWAGDFPVWDVPADAKSTANPVAKSKSGIDAGRNIYNTQCKACHGEKGDGKGAVKAANLTSAEFQSQTDGAIHYKLLTGRSTMPSFKALPDADLWNVIHFLRGFGESAIQVAKKKATIILQKDEKADKRRLVAVVQSSGAPAAGVSVGMYTKRYFGLLPLPGSPVKTNENGYASIDVPEGIPGDTALNLVLVGRIDDSDYEPAEALQTAAWGTAPPPDKWDSDRQLWKPNTHVPFWIAGIFFGLLIGVLAGVGYVALLVLKIWKLGQQA